MNLYVSNLGFNFQTEELAILFMEYGAVSSAKVVADKFTNRSKGFGFVEMPDQHEAEKAMNDLNGKEIDGRVISVTEARPPKERPRYSNRY
ncbi:RNA-binding protein [Chitinophaga oryzae]|uniref:RNA-binding protein n=1 Tax=Chitinophaga oryzae TaxID=2725414 RepID=A0AAE7D6X1_9BACT|nr:RNA-binding protein [Chitinophaga oryzae]QJB31742.1 RNA-binding protein [Chitinophaga oryzae]QJB38226.1 RNA-binding protein [Chitinophaga oryzae]